MKRGWRVTCGALAVAGVLLAPTLAHAQTAPRGHHHHGHHHDDGPAATTAAPAPSGASTTPCTTGDARELAQHGWRLQADSHWLDAQTCLTAAQAAGGSWTRHHRSELTSSLAMVAQHVGHFQVVGGVDGAVVSLSGTQIATLPMSEPVRVLAGRVRLTVTAEGHYPIEREIPILAGNDPTMERVSPDEMRPLPQPVSVPVAVVPVVEPTPVVVVVPHVMEPITPVMGLQRTPGGHGWRDVGLVTAIATVPSIGLGVGGTLMALGNASSYTTYCTNGPPSSRKTGCADEASRVTTGEVLEWVGYGVGAALIVTAVVAFTRSAPTEHGGVAWRCGEGPGAVGIACGGSFQ